MLQDVSPRFYGKSLPGKSTRGFRVKHHGGPCQLLLTFIKGKRQGELVKGKNALANASCLLLLEQQHWYLSYSKEKYSYNGVYALPWALPTEQNSSKVFTKF